MSLEDWAFVLGPLGAFVLVPVAAAVVATGQRPRWLTVVMSLVVVTEAALVVGHWVVWALAFDYVRGEPVPNHLFPVSTVLMMASAAGCLVVSALAGATLLRRLVSAA